jgi:hypothetical protein
LQISSELDIGLSRKLVRCGRITIGDEVVHDQVIDITETKSLATMIAISECKFRSGDVNQKDKSIVSPHLFSERFPT